MPKGKLIVKQFKCKVCRKVFYDVLSRDRKTCSKKCQNKKSHLDKKGKYPIGIKNWSKENGCWNLNKKLHYAVWNKGKRLLKYRNENSSNWRGGKHILNTGYMVVWCKIRRKYILKHRMVLEKHLKRKLSSTEHVHHVDKDKSNNRIKNLMLFKSNSAHRRFEGNKFVDKKEILFDGRKYGTS